MSGYLYILEHGGLPDLIQIDTTKLPIEEVMQKLPPSSECTHLWACDWPHKIKKAVHLQFDKDRVKELGGHSPVPLENYFKVSD